MIFLPPRIFPSWPLPVLSDVPIARQNRFDRLVAKTQRGWFPLSGGRSTLCWKLSVMRRHRRRKKAETEK